MTYTISLHTEFDRIGESLFFFNNAQKPTISTIFAHCVKLGENWAGMAQNKYFLKTHSISTDIRFEVNQVITSRY